jgi:hypothetical protein
MDEPEISHGDWEVLLLARKIFGDQQNEKPWIRHQQVEPTIKLHLAEPKSEGDEPSKCICGDEIPALVMQKFYWLKAVCEGKRAGERVTP